MFGPGVDNAIEKYLVPSRELLGVLQLWRASQQIIFRYDVIFFFKDTATTDIYTTYDTLSLHDALPISNINLPIINIGTVYTGAGVLDIEKTVDRKSTRLNSSHRRLSRMPSSA